MSLTFEAVSHRYGRATVVDGVSLTARAGQIHCLLGPSGSGKSTLLRLAAGLETIQSGRLLLNGELLAEPGNSPPPERRPVGLVFQDHILYPHRTVAQNVAFGLHALPRTEQARTVQKQLDTVGLADLADRYPDTLSGGQQQRVGLARALAPGPAVMLLDEPFASVDATLRRELRESTRRALKEAGAITVVVTHDPVEAMELADEITFISHGRVLQTGTPDQIWRAPADRSVALAFGDSQALEGRATSGGIQTAFGLVPVRELPPPNTPVSVVLRPDSARLASSGNHTHPRAVIEDIRFRGDGFTVIVNGGGHRLRIWQADVAHITAGDEVAVTFDPDRLFVFAASDAR